MTSGEKRRLAEVFGVEGAEEAQEGKALEAWERAFKAFTEARENCLKALITIQTLKATTEARALSEEDVTRLSEEVADAYCAAAWALGEGLDQVKEAIRFQNTVSDTERPPPEASPEAQSCEAESATN